jgi:hypothetical protein
MNKRSAMLTAGGLVLTLLVAGIAMAMGVTGPTADAKTTSRAKPIVRTVTRTVTVHQKAQGGSSGAVRSDPSSAGGSSVDGSEDDQYESDEYEDDQYESDEYEGEEHESDDD